MINLEGIQKRFTEATEKEYWEKLKILLFSEDKENVVSGMNLFKTLDEEVYYDGLCSFLEDDGSGNWTLNAELDCENDSVLMLEVIVLAEENTKHEMKKAFDKGYFDKMLVDTCRERKIEELSESQKERLLSKLGEMVVVHTDHGSFSVMKYQVTQALWDSVGGRNPSELQGAGLSVDQVSWLDCVIFANKMSEKEGLEKVYEISDEVQNA